MNERLRWIDRHFVFDLPLSMFPNVLERLRGTPARIEERVRGRDAATLRRRLENTWSVQENIGHLVEVEALWLGRLDDFAADLTQLRPADMSNARTDAAGYNSRNLEEVLSRFRAVRGQFIGRLESLPPLQLLCSAHHPRLNQPMRILDLMVFAAEHDDHHLARISELLMI